MSGRLRGRWAVLAALGALAVVLCAMITTRAPGAGVAPGRGVQLGLAEGGALSWAFTTERGGLTGLGLWLAEPAPAGAELAVRITPADNPTVALAETVVALDGAGDGGVEAGFAPIWVRASPHDPTVTLVVQVSPRGLMPGAEVALRGGSGPGDPAPAYTPYYSERPFDQLWPITAMAEGRSGPLGMPSLYALLAYSFLVTLARSLWLVARSVEGAQPSSPN